MSNSKQQRAQQAREQARRSKADLRQELEQATRQFLHGGGSVTEVPTGTSAWAPGSRPPPSKPLFTEPRTERTPLNDVVAALEERRALKRKRGTVKRSRKPTARRKTLYDDFGEPLRRVWAED